VLRTKLLQWATERLARGTTSKRRGLPPGAFQGALCECFCAQNAAAIERAVTGYFRGARVTVGFDPGAVRSAMSCLWSRSESNGSHFTFPTFHQGRLVDTVVNRWLALFELFLHLDRPGNPAGRVVINFNDAGVEPGLAFSGDSPDYVLIPDPDFMKSRGYMRAREHFQRNLQSWDQRCAMVFWRGSSLGQKDQAIFDMPRARLCQLANSAPDALFDVGIADVFDVSDSDADQLRASGLIKDRVPWKHLNKYRFHIDIDGHANSFAGLFLKLLSGGLVLKVASPHQYRQWYYDRLKPWENFVPVASDMSDLLQVAAYCRDHDELAQRIAKNGRQLALSLTFEKEFAGAVRAVQKAFSNS
jgi:hypothetical protein